MKTTSDEYWAVVDAYWDRFNRPPFWQTDLDVSGQMEAIRKAIEIGEPLPLPTAPPGALI